MAIKLHVYRTEMGDDGTESCDYRGKGELGAGENDQHRTVEEIDPADQSEIDFVLEHGPEINKGFQALTSVFGGKAGNLATLLGLEGSGPVGLRIGVWDH